MVINNLRYPNSELTNQKLYLLIRIDFLRNRVTGAICPKSGQFGEKDKVNTYYKCYQITATFKTGKYVEKASNLSEIYAPKTQLPHRVSFAIRGCLNKSSSKR